MNFSRSIFLLSIVMLLNGCGTKGTQSGSTVEVTDAVGRKVQVPTQIDRLVAVNAGAMRMIAYMGAIDKVVGVEDRELQASRPYNLAFPEIKQKPVIGPQSGGDAELILKARPQVIFWTSSAKANPDDLQAKTGIPVVVLENGELGVESEKFFKSLRVIGQVLQTEARAAALIAYIEQQLATLKTLTDAVPAPSKPTCYVGGLSYNGSHGIYSTRANFAPFTLTQAPNVAAELNQKALNTKPLTIDAEKLLQWNPSVIFVDADGWKMAKAELQPGSLLHQNLQAVQQGKIYLLPRYINNSFSYDYDLIGAWFVGKTLYPNQFKAIDMTQKATEILEKFYDKKINLADFDVIYGPASEKVGQ